LSPLIKKLSFPEDSRFYEKWSMLFLLADIIIFSLINISFSYYFVWAFVFVSLSLFFSDRKPKMILYAIAPFWMVKLVIDFFIVVPEYRLSNALLLNPVLGNMILTLSLTPFILLGSSVLLNFGVTLRKIRRQHIGTGMAISAVCIICFLFIVFSLPNFTKDHSQQVLVRDSIDMNAKTNKIIVSSDSSIGGLAIWDEKEYYSFFTNSKKYTIPKQYIPDLLGVTASSETFLSRKNITITISPSGAPYQMKCVLKSQKEFALLDSNFPFTKQDSGKSYSLTIGVNPPAPLPVEVTIPKDVSLECEIEANYLSFPFRFEATGANKEIKNMLSVQMSIDLLNQ
jgi:hypothetical protein